MSSRYSDTMRLLLLGPLVVTVCACGSSDQPNRHHRERSAEATLSLPSQSAIPRKSERAAAPTPPSIPTSTAERDLPTAPIESPAEPAAEPPGKGATPAKGGHDFAAEVVALYQLAACDFDTEPAYLRVSYYRQYCASLTRSINHYRTRWLHRAAPKLAELVPDDIPDVLVYPFGGGDLVTALATFPAAREITTVSLEVVGDARVPARLSKTGRKKLLTHAAQLVRFLLLSAHSKTSSMGEVMRSELPGQLILGLIAMSIHGHEPMSLRYLSLRDDGSVRYHSADDIAEALRAAKGEKARAQVFAHAEVEFRKRGEADAPMRVWRHFSGNLSDKHLPSEHTLLKHLRAKGPVSAMTKAASYLLWYANFSTIRQYLLDHAVWMISDSTGIMPKAATAAGFEQLTYGTFEKPIMSPGIEGTSQFRKLWRSQPKRPLAFRYGYPDGSAGKHAHLLITRKSNSSLNE